MKWLINIIFFLLSVNCFCQEIKHVEIISEIRDSMVLLNKDDVDSINKMFFEKYKLDSLNLVNEEIILNLELKSSKLDSILSEQKAIIMNDSIIRIRDKAVYEDKIAYYKKEVKKQSNRKIFYQSTTGVSILAIILILLL